MDSPAPKLIFAEQSLCVATLDLAGNIVGAAQLLGITRAQALGVTLHSGLTQFLAGPGGGSRVKGAHQA